MMVVLKEGFDGTARPYTLGRAEAGMHAAGGEANRSPSSAPSGWLVGSSLENLAPAVSQTGQSPLPCALPARSRIAVLREERSIAAHRFNEERLWPRAAAESQRDDDAGLTPVFPRLWGASDGEVRCAHHAQVADVVTCRVQESCGSRKFRRANKGLRELDRADDERRTMRRDLTAFVGE